MDIIPIHIYKDLFYYAMFFIVLISFLHAQTLSLGDKRTISFNHNFGVLILGFTILYIGLRPIHGVFVDMTTYARTFERLSFNEFKTEDFKDPIFYGFMYLCSQIMTASIFFLICAFIYILPLYFASKKLFKDYWFYAFLILITSMSFWAYGTNGIRNGMATSIFIYAITKENLKYKIVWLLISIVFHKTMLLPAFAYLAYYKLKPNIYLLYSFWLIAIPSSLLLGSFWENLIGSIGIDDERMGYFVTQADERFSQTGFRWDFLIYSSVSVLISYYFISKKRFNDFFYKNIVATYLFTNAFWILIIRVNFSNRFAYLSWFLMGLIIIYPFLKMQFFKNQHSKIGLILLPYFLFTFFMGIILSN